MPRSGCPRATRLRYRATVRASVRAAAHVLTVSEYSKADIVRVYGVDPARVTVVPTPWTRDWSQLLEATPADRGRSSDRADGRQRAAAQEPAGGGPGAYGCCVTGARTSCCVSSAPCTRPAGRTPSGLVELLGDAVPVAGYVSTAELAAELSRAHVLAFPSLFEGFGIPALEAMAAGVPVVVSDRTSLPEVVGDAGLVVPAEDPEAWADALQRAPRARRVGPPRGGR